MEDGRPERANEKPEIQDYHFRDLELVRREVNDVAWSMDRTPTAAAATAATTQCEVFKVQGSAAF